MIRVQLHHDGVVYGAIVWTKPQEWEIVLRPVDDLHAMAQDIHAWILGTQARKLHLAEWSPRVQEVAEYMVREFKYDLRVPSGVSAGHPYLERKE